MKKYNIIKIIIATLLINISFFLCGCGGGEIGKTYTTEQDKTVATLVSGWEKMKQSSPSSAKATFEAALSETTDPEQIAEANLGIGWAVTKDEGIRNAKEYFENSLNYYDDAKIGMAGYYLSTADPDNYAKGITILENLNLDNIKTIYSPKYETGVTNTDVHALLGILYYFSGQMTKANEQLQFSKTEISGSNDTKTTNINDIVDQLL